MSYKMTNCGLMWKFRFSLISYIKQVLVLSSFCLIVYHSTAFSQSSSAPVDTLQIDQVVDDVVHHNDRLAAARFMELSAQAKIGPAGAWDDPMLMIGVVNLPTSLDFTMDDMTMKMIGLSQNVPYSGYKGLQSKAAKSDANAAVAERQSSELNLVAAAKSAYYDLYYRSRILNELLRQKELLTQIAASTLGKLKTNQATQEEYLSAQSNLWRNESEILSAEQELDEFRHSLNALRGIQPDTPLPPLAQPPVAQIPDNASPWLEAAYANYPELRRLGLVSESYGLSAAASRRMAWPMLTLSANYGIRKGIGMSGPRDNMIGFQAEISLPFLSGRQQKNMARSMSAMSQSTLASANQLKRDTEARIRSLHQRAMRLSKSLQLYQDRIVPDLRGSLQKRLCRIFIRQNAIHGIAQYRFISIS